jgi:hypothetical protein
MQCNVGRYRYALENKTEGKVAGFARREYGR